MIPVFITGIGTDVGKTLVSAIVSKALGAAYWKPIQAGGLEKTDADIVTKLTGTYSYEEVYLLKTPASPHIAARKEGLIIDIKMIVQEFLYLQEKSPEFIVIEGAGGLLVPINDRQTMANLIKKLGARIIIVSRNYLGSINHSLLTASYCRHHKMNVAGWIFTDESMGYEQEISQRSGYPMIARIPFLPEISEGTVSVEAEKIRSSLLKALKVKT